MPRVDVALGKDISAWLANGRWVTGTVTANAGDTLQIDDGRRHVPLRDLRELHVATGERGTSGSRVVVMGLAGIMFGLLGGGVAAEATNPCADSSGEICLDGLAYMVAGAGAGLFLGLVTGSIPVQKWERVYPPEKDSRASDARVPRDLWQPDRHAFAPR